MENFPDIKTGQFVVLFVGRQYGHVYDHSLIIFQDTPTSNQKAYAVFDSLELAKQYADNKIATENKTNLDFGYLIYNHRQKVVVNTDTGGLSDET